MSCLTGDVTQGPVHALHDRQQPESARAQRAGLVPVGEGSAPRVAGPPVHAHHRVELRRDRRYARLARDGRRLRRRHDRLVRAGGQQRVVSVGGAVRVAPARVTSDGGARRQRQTPVAARPVPSDARLAAEATRGL